MIFPTWYMLTVALFLVILAGSSAIAHQVPQDTHETFGELEAEWVFGDLEDI